MTASLMLKKLASYPKQNGLAKALREIGRIERTLFMLDWFRDPSLRRRVQAGLNKGEGIALARLRGAYRGRKKSLSSEQQIEVRRRATDGEKKAQLAREFGISRETLYQYLKQPD